MLIHKTQRKNWTNRHESMTIKIDNLYDLANNDTHDNLADYNDATKGIQGILKEAIDSNKKIRVLGGEWSWTEITATNGILLNTKPLNISFRINKSNLSDKYLQTPEDLYFAQCGVSVKELNDRLRSKGRSLKTSGASNGQTIAGAMSTGTHGAAIDIGSVADYVVGLHIIVSPSRHVWLERNSYPVVSDTFSGKLNAELVRNDDLFNAALVSFGSFGFIHGVMVETSPLFLYEGYRFQLSPGKDLYKLMENLDFKNTAIKLPKPNERPYHFQALINQYNKTNGAYVTIMYNRPMSANPNYKPPVSPNGIAPGDDLPTFIGTLASTTPSLVPLLVNKVIGKSYAPYKELYGTDDVWGTHGEIFSNTDLHGKVLSSAMGVSLESVNKVRELFIKLNDTIRFCGVIAFRYVKGTNATLGFTKFSTTCVIELDCVHSKKAHEFYNMFWDQMFANNIPYTFHWGKMFNLDKLRLRKMYSNKIDSWIKARNELMKEKDCLSLFTNDLMLKLGLDTITAGENPIA